MGNTTRAFVAGTTAAAALLLGACGTPVPEQATTTTEDDSSTQRCRVERDTIRTALEAWAIEHDGYPAALDELVGVFIEHSPEFPWAYASTGAAYTLTGPCGSN